MQKRSRFPTQKILPMASKMMHVRSLIWCFCLKHNTCNFIRQQYYVILIAAGFFCKNLKYRCGKKLLLSTYGLSDRTILTVSDIYLDVQSMSEIHSYKDLLIWGYFSFGLIKLDIFFFILFFNFSKLPRV